MPDNEIELIKRLIEQEESFLLENGPSHKRIGILELIRETDCSTYIAHYYDQLHSKKELQSNIGNALFGFNKALSIFVDDSCLQHGAPNMPSNNKSSRWARSVLHRCAILSNLEQLLEYHRLQLGTILRTDSTSFEFIPRSDFTGVETIERNYFQWISQQILDRSQKKIMEASKDAGRIHDIMGKLVSPWKQHFIQYNADPEVDNYYHELGEQHVMTMHGYDCFPPVAKFGNISYGKLINITEAIIGRSFKHIGFCHQLLKKAPHLDMANILTIFKEDDALTNEYALGLCMTKQEAKNTISLLTLDYSDFNQHLGIPGSVGSPYIRIAKGLLIERISPGLENPFFYLLRKLKRSYPDDWDKAVDKREEIFRTELIYLFGSFMCPVFSDNINIKLSGRIVTDIDALVIDPRNNAIGLFQLKWQEPFGHSLRERESRKRNMLSTGNKWINVVTDWLETTSANDKERTLCLPKGSISSNTQFRLFVIGRNAAHYSGQGAPDYRAAWGIWPQVIKLFKERDIKSNPIMGLFNELHGDVPTNKVKDEVRKERYEVQLQGYNIVVHP